MFYILCSQTPSSDCPLGDLAESSVGVVAEVKRKSKVTERRRNQKGSESR